MPYYASGIKRYGKQGCEKDRALLTTFERVSAAVARGGFNGIGLATLPDTGLVVLDFDHCVAADGTVDPRVVDLVLGTYCEFSPSGTGLHAFFDGTLVSRKDNVDKTLRNPDGTRKDGLFDVEFFGHNGYVTFTGAVTPDCEMFGWSDVVLPLTPAVLALYEQRFGTGSSMVPVGGAAGADDEVDDLLGLHTTLGWTLEYARGLLADCDPGAERQTWLQVLMAMHHEFGGALEALDLCAEWSAGALWAGGQPDNYGGRGAVESSWRSFGRTGGAAITGRWLLAWHKEQAGKRGYEARDAWRKALAEAPDEFTIREKVCQAIAKDQRLDELGREALAQALAVELKRVGVKFSLGQCRKLVAERAPEKARGKSDGPIWLDGWVYVSDDDKFYRMDSDEWLSMQGFNAKFNRELPAGEGEVPVNAAWVALTHYCIPTVTRGVYLPWAAPLFEMDGISCVNTYRPSSVPSAVEALSEAGRGAVALVRRHLSLLCGGRADVEQTFVDWLAHNVQHPGAKIRWAPLVKGIEGDGKTVIGLLLASVMGRVNVRNVSPKVLGTDFTGWAEGSSVVVLEEIKLTGHNRYDILNALKPFITNDSTEIHRKGKDGYDSINTTNYVAFTNYSDALPLTDTDRRWWILFTPFNEIAALSAAIGPGAPREVLGAYFTQLHDTIQQYRSELRRWLLDHKISPSFKPNGSAPFTREKQLMIGMGMSEEEQSVREVLATGAVGVTRDVFLSSYLRNAVVELGTPLDSNTSAWSRLLGRVGYTRQPKKLKWKGRSENVWVRGSKNMEPEQIRRVLRETLPVGSSEDDEELF